MAKQKHLSVKPSEAEAGGNFGWPAGSTVEIIGAKWGTWEEAGEKALVGERSADDPALILEGQIEGEDNARPPVFLSAGKAKRAVPSSDGEYLDPADGSSATAFNNQCKAYYFLESLTDKKTHGKNAMPEDQLDNPISEVLVGLKFVVGTKKVKQPGGDKGEGTAMVVEEIVELPGGKKKSKKKEEDQDDEDVAPKKGKGKAKADEVQDEKAAMRAVVALLENPKNRNGVPSAQLYTKVYNSVKGEDNADAIMEFVKDDEWCQDGERPWEYDSDEELYKKAS